jgi:tetratricopeptide (TPR) repeat protein
MVKGLFLYSQTYEAQEQYNKAIECLNLIEKIDISMQTSEDNIYAKSLLNLGRLHFRQTNLELAYKNLKAFFKKAKSTDNKELLDIGRVNLGMIRGTQAMKEYIDMTKQNDFDSFLKMKLKFFSDTN